MTASAAIPRLANAPPRIRARIAGVLYLVIFIAAPSGAATLSAPRMAVTLACDTAVAFLLYDLLSPASRVLALLAAFYRLVFVGIMAIGTLRYLGLPPFLRGDHAAATFNASYGTAVALFGFHCLVVGYLVLRSAFLPRLLGALMVLAGVGWLSYLWPPLARGLFPWVLVPGVVGEGSLTLWLLVLGVNDQRWYEQAARPRSELPS